MQSVSPAVDDSKAHELWSVAAISLAASTAIFGAPLLVRCWLDEQVDYNEGWNAFRQQAASLWQPLYGQPPDLAVTNYPPLLFHLLGLIAKPGGDVVLVSRLASILAVIVIGGVATLIGYRQSTSRAVAACCGLGWIAGLEFWTPARIGADDPQLLAMAIQSVGLAIFVLGSRQLVCAALSACVLTTALFGKHNLLAVPGGLTVYLLLQRDWLRLLVWSFSGLGTGAILFIVTMVTDGRFFLAHLLTPRLFFVQQAVAMSALYTGFSLPTLITICLWIRRGGFERLSSPIVLVWIASLLEILAFSGGDGVAKNIFQDAIFSGSLLLPLALHAMNRRHGGRGDHSRAMIALAPLYTLPLLLGVTAASNYRALEREARQQAELRRVVALLRAQPGPVACEALLLCFQAEKPSVFDSYYVLDQIRLGRMPSRRIDDLVARQQLAAVEIGTPDDQETGDPTDQPLRLSRSFMQALWTHYRPVMSTNGMTVFMPISRRSMMQAR